MFLTEQQGVVLLCPFYPLHHLADAPRLQVQSQTMVSDTPPSRERFVGHLKRDHRLCLD